MPGIVLGEASSCATPLLPFFYQTYGVLTDIDYLKWEIYPIDSSVKQAELVVDMDDCSSGGHKVGTGYYVAALDPSAESLGAGPYEILWKYKVTATGPELTTSYFFEVLDPKYFRSSQMYVGYISSKESAFTTWELQERQRAVMRASKEVDRLTQRYFFPRYYEQLVTVRVASAILWVDDPIIGIGKIEIEGGTPAVGIYTTTEIGLNSVKIYNRHLGGLASPDDREDPRIEYSPIEAEELVEYGLSKFPIGAQNIRVTGVFGYTDPNGSPFGETPMALRDVVTALGYRYLKDPLGEDPFMQQMNRIEMAKTRDQQIKFGKSSVASQTTSLTGDPRLDMMLAPYCRPWHVGSAGGQ